MSDSDTQHPGSTAPARGPDEHEAPDGHDDLVHGSAALGPIDVQAWGALVVGAGMGLIVALCVALSTGAL
jgi:hypothetical protein